MVRDTRYSRNNYRSGWSTFGKISAIALIGATAFCGSYFGLKSKDSIFNYFSSKKSAITRSHDSESGRKKTHAISEKEVPKGYELEEKETRPCPIPEQTYVPSVVEQPQSIKCGKFYLIDFKNENGTIKEISGLSNKDIADLFNSYQPAKGLSRTGVNGIGVYNGYQFGYIDAATKIENGSCIDQKVISFDEGNYENLIKKESLEDAIKDICLDTNYGIVVTEDGSIGFITGVDPQKIWKGEKANQVIVNDCGQTVVINNTEYVPSFGGIVQKEIHVKKILRPFEMQKGNPPKRSGGEHPVKPINPPDNNGGNGNRGGGQSPIRGKK
jgi:hypothetical protein